MQTPLRILLVEDDARIRCEVMESLRADGFEIDVCVSLADASRAVDRNPDLVMLDLGMPDGDGLDFCRALRRAGLDLPVVVLTARDAPEERVRGLDAGADDYVVKPFYMPELLARIRSVLRRAGRSPGLGPLRCAALWLDPTTRTAGVGERNVELKPREFDLLEFLLKRPGRIWTRDQLLDRVWGASFDGDARTVDSHVRRLRSAIEEDPADPRYIQTVWGVGYRMREVEA